MSIDRAMMQKTLKASCVPVLRELGFKGSFPNFHRETGRFVALANFQFGGAGGSFCVNLSYADPARRNVTHAPETEPAKLHINQTRDRKRLGAAGGGDHWFVFDNPVANTYRGAVLPPEELAAQCNALFLQEAQDWWAKKEADPRS